VQEIQITPAIARKVLEVVDAGLVKGMGNPVPGEMCVEAAVCYAMGLPHGDQPSCVSPALRQLKIRLNDARWSSDVARSRGLRRLALAQLGSAGNLDEREFAKRCARLAIQTSVPVALRAAASIASGERKEKLLAAAATCEQNPTRENALEAKKIAYAYAAAAAYAAYAADAAYAAAAAYADAAADAAAYAADAAYADAAAAAAAAAYAAAAAAAAYADADAHAAAHAAADAAADAHAYAAAAAAAYADAYADAAAYAYAAAAAAAAAYAAAAAAADRSLAAFAEGVVQILVEMKAPGCEWLGLTEESGDLVS